jgi:hypothetical protein
VKSVKDLYGLFIWEVLIDIIKELLIVKDSTVFWKHSWLGFPGIFAQRCSNRHGRFLMGRGILS